MKREDGSFPRLISNKIKGGMVLNWAVHKGQEDLLLNEFVDKREKEYINEEFDWLSDEKDNFDVFDVELNKEIDETEI